MQRHTPSRRVLFVAGIAILSTVALAFATSGFGTGTADSVEIAKLKRQVKALQKEVNTLPAMRSQISVLNVSSRIAYLDAMGFHGLETSAKAGTLTDRNAIAIKNALKVTSKIGWPQALAQDAKELQESLQAFATAWDAGDKEAVLEAMEAIHGAAHALSVNAYEWLGR